MEAEKLEAEKWAEAEKQQRKLVSAQLAEKEAAEKEHLRVAATQKLQEQRT